jgi:hypothetical protein
MTAALHLEGLRDLTDRVDTKYGDDDIVAALVGSIDALIEALTERDEPTADVDADADTPKRTPRRYKKGRPQLSGYRNVYWSKKSQKWSARITLTTNGKRKHYYCGYFTDPAHASQAAEEKRKELGME